MLKQRFSLLSIIVILTASSLATFGMMQVQGHGFAGHTGFPFAWRWWSEWPINGAHFGYNWLGLVLDIAIWFCAVIALGVLVESIIQKVTANPKDDRRIITQRVSLVSCIGMLIASSAIAVAMLQWQREFPEAYRGFPFAWTWYSQETLDGAHYVYRWSGLALDLAIWFTLIIALGVMVEYVIERVVANREDKHKIAA